MGCIRGFIAARIGRYLFGGEMQRVSIGRALVRNPSIFLMDEHLSSLDVKRRADLRIELKAIHADSGATLLYVTHDQTEAMTMATHIGVPEQGRLTQFGSEREIYQNPNALPADLFGPAPPGARSMGLRPEQIMQGQGKDAKVVRVEHLGDQTRLHLSFKNHGIVTVTEAHTPLVAGDVVKINPEQPFYFDANGARLT